MSHIYLDDSPPLVHHFFAMKDGLRQVVGKTISGVLVADVANSSRRQVFLVFDDDTHFELWGHEIDGTGGVDPGGMDKVRSYAEKSRAAVVLMETAPENPQVSRALPSITHQNKTQTYYGQLIFWGFVLAAVAFGMGRANPLHTFQQFSSGSYLYDTHTGKVCAPFRKAQQLADAANATNGDAWAQKAEQLKNTLPKRTEDMIPACGSE